MNSHFQHSSVFSWTLVLSKDHSSLSITTRSSFCVSSILFLFSLRTTCSVSVCSSCHFFHSSFSVSLCFIASFNLLFSLSRDTLPILDIQVRVNNNKAEYIFFKKEMSNHMVMMARSAMPNKIKLNSLVQEVIRRLRNTSRELPWSVKANILFQFSHSLMCSEYSEDFRLKVIQAGVIGFERQCQVVDNALRISLHRLRCYLSRDLKICLVMLLQDRLSLLKKWTLKAVFNWSRDL